MNDAHPIGLSSQRPHQGGTSPVVDGSNPQIACLPFDVGPFVGSIGARTLGKEYLFGRVSGLDSRLGTDIPAIAVESISSYGTGRLRQQSLRVNRRIPWKYDLTRVCVGSKKSSYSYVRICVGT
jgi:hypothetical protein